MIPALNTPIKNCDQTTTNVRSIVNAGIILQLLFQELNDNNR